MSKQKQQGERQGCLIPRPVAGGEGQERERRGLFGGGADKQWKASACGCGGGEVGGIRGDTALP